MIAPIIINTPLLILHPKNSLIAILISLVIVILINILLELTCINIKIIKINDNKFIVKQRKWFIWFKLGEFSNIVAALNFIERLIRTGK